MIKLYECLRHEHDWRLVVIAAAICLISTFAASVTLSRVYEREGFARWPWLLMLSTVVGFGIWATHFVAMLAYEPGVGFAYDLSQTILSLIVILSIGIPAFALIAQQQFAILRLSGAALLGLGISAMHYTGMYGLLPKGFMRWDLTYVGLSIVLGILLSVAAVEVYKHFEGYRAKLGFTVLLTLAICADHFFGMSALTLLPLSQDQVSSTGVSPFMMGALIGTTAIIVLQIIIVISVLDSWIWRTKAVDVKRNRELDVLHANIGNLARVWAWNVDVETRKVSWSKEIVNYLGIDQDEDFSLEQAAKYLIGEDSEKFIEAVNEAMTAGTGFDLELALRITKDNVLWLRVLCEPFYEDGKLQKLIGIVQDVSRHKIERDILQQALNDADQANKLKSEFLATMSHELRTPMNGVMGMAQLLEQTPLNPKQKMLTQTLVSSGNSLLSIINDVLDVSKMETGLLEIHNAEFSLVDLVKDAVSNVEGIALQKELPLSYRISSDLSPSYIGDDFRIKQILVNLLGNALKFTETGGVQLLAKPDEAQNLVFYVVDSGPGIPENQQKAIFNSFTQADGSITRKHGGTGLGLSISKNLADLMDGEIGVQSQLDKGSVFWLKLPLQPVEAESRQKLETDLHSTKAFA